MSFLQPYKLIILILCFALTSVVIYQEPASKAANKKHSLSDALAEITGWKLTGADKLDPKIVEALELDDNVNQTYSNGKDTVFLYIGYYLTTKKVGAAHDPLVCFPGQGWVVREKAADKYALAKTKDAISYATMTAEKGAEKQLILYWFQSYDQANPDTFFQKLSSFWKRLLGRGQDNAFVRISTPMGDRSLEQCQETILNFVESFYPVFLDYVREDNWSDRQNS